MSFLEHVTFLQKKSLILLAGLLASNAFALQPVSEDNLAVATGDRSPVAFVNFSSQGNVDPQQSLNEENLEYLKQQISLTQLQQYYAPLQASMRMMSNTLEHKQNDLAIKSQEKAESSLAVEDLGVMWDNGNLVMMADLSTVVNLVFGDTSLIKYEVKDIKGRLKITTTFN